MLIHGSLILRVIDNCTILLGFFLMFTIGNSFGATLFLSCFLYWITVCGFKTSLFFLIFHNPIVVVEPLTIYLIYDDYLSGKYIKQITEQ